MKKNEKLTLIKLLLNSSPKMFLLSVFLSAFSGGLYALIIPTILAGVNREYCYFNCDEYSDYIEVFFFVLISMVLITKASSVILVSNVAKSAIAEMRIKLSSKINQMEVSEIENIGFSKLLNILTEDVNRITNAALALPMLLVSLVTVVGMLTYLAILDRSVFIFTIITILIGIALFQLPIRRAKKYYTSSRELRDDMLEGFRGLVFGSYELKLNTKKSEVFLKNEIATPTNKSVIADKKGDFILHLAGNSSEVLCFFAIGMIVFLLPRVEGGDHQSLLGIIMALLYITAPVSTILGLIQQLKIGAISLEKINSIYKVRRSENKKLGIIKKNWTNFSLSGINYSYSVGDKSFSIEEVSLSISRGQVYFVVGGNGSGKSTLCKIISLHYSPEVGELYLDNEVLKCEDLMSFRQCFFVIYSDFYLFDTIYKTLDEKDYSLIRKYLKIFELDNKTQIINNKFTTINLSDGQRRRLALLVALVEDKDIFILDEWAADQDPKFKKLFYQTLLPDLKRKGKTVVCVTHDDRYFFHCDQVIKMEDGKVVDIYKSVKK